MKAKTITYLALGAAAFVAATILRKKNSDKKSVLTPLQEKFVETHEQMQNWLKEHGMNEWVVNNTTLDMDANIKSGKIDPFAPKIDTSEFGRILKR